MSRLVLAVQIRPGILLIAGTLTMAFTRPSDAQILKWPPDPPQPAKTESALEDEVKVLQIDAAPEPEPALRYRFWPIAGEETSGNAMTLIQRASIIRLEQRAIDPPDAMFENYEQWMHGPLEQLPRDEVRKYLAENELALAEIHRAALMRDSELEVGLENLNGRDVVLLPLNDLQNARDLSRLLALEIRLALSEQRYEDAIRSLRAGFRLAEATGQASDLIVARLIGFAIAGQMLSEVQELIVQPHSPNLYWAFASLPPSISEMRRAAEFESNLTGRFLPGLTNIPQEMSLGDPAWRERHVELVSQFFSIGGLRDDGDQMRVQSQLMAGALVIVFDHSAREYLQEIGYAAAAVEGMSPSEVVLRGTRERLQRIQDGYTKWALLPRPMAEGYWSEADDLYRLKTVFPDPATTLINLVMPAIQAAQSAGTRTEQSIAFLATVEALRMHAAEYGHFPESLENLQPVPAFSDPATGELFEYERISDTQARLEREPVHPGQPDTMLRLELRK